MMNRIYISCVCLVMISSLAKGQDALYSQFYNSNVILNPALTGVFDGQQRFALNYRNQWSNILRSKSYQTYSAQFDAKIHMKRNDFLAYGLNFTRDQAGDGVYLQQSGHANISYIKQVGVNAYSNVSHFLVGGLKFGMGQNRLKPENLWFGSQFDTNSGSINFGAPTGEELINSNGSSPMFGDFGLGLLYYNVMGERKTSYVGFSATHLNQPGISLTEFGDFRLKRLYTFHAGGEFPVNNELSLMPNAVAFFQDPARMFMPGMHLRYTHKDWKEIALRAGMWTRIVRGSDRAIINDAVIFSTTFEYEAWLLGLSYDVTTSSLVRSNSGRGAFEFSIQYRNRSTKYRQPIKCPKF